MNYRFAFVVEQVLGHVTHSQNLKRVVEKETDITPQYVDLWPDHMPFSSGNTELPGRSAGLSLLRRVPSVKKSWALSCSLEAYAQLRPQIKNLDAILFHTQQTALGAHLLPRKTPFVISLDSSPYSHFYYPPTDSGRTRDRKMALYKKLFGRAQHLVTFSQWTADNLMDDYDVPQDKISVLPSGVDTKLFCPGMKTESGGPVRILFVGRDFRNKGGMKLLRWARHTTLRNWELHLVTHSEVPVEKYGLQNVRVYNNLKNNSPELIELYQSCDIFVLPTRTDCFSFVAMEALSCGLPVITTRVGGVDEIVREGQTGFLIARDDEATLSTKVDELVANENLRLAQGVAARQDAVQRFDAAINYSALLDIMRNVSAKSKPGNI